MTKMPESNIALVFGPTLMQSPEAGMGAPGEMQVSSFTILCFPIPMPPRRCAAK